MPKQKNNLPERFLERCQEIFGHYYFDQIQNTFIKRPVTFRVNTIKAKRDEVLEILRREGFKIKLVSWYSDAFILSNKKQNELEDTDLYKNGKIYLQSLASMVPPLVLAPAPGEKVLDLTAAPGSKTSQLAALMNMRGELMANDNNEIRFQKLRHNMELLGCDSCGNDSGFCTLYNESGVKLCTQFPNYFDKILLDAPCSAEARIISSDRRTYGFWKERNIKDHAFHQRQLLFAAWSALRPGGTLVYSTCTFAPEENEAQISRFLESFPDAKIVEARFNGLQNIEAVLKWKGKELNKQIKKCWRLLPTSEIEGFFICKILKYGPKENKYSAR